MPKTFHIKKKVVVLSDNNRTILRHLDESLALHFKDHKTLIGDQVVKTSDGWWVSFVSPIERIVGTPLGTQECILQGFPVTMDLEAFKLREKYIDFLNELVIKAGEKPSAIEPEDQKIKSRYILVYEILIRLVTVALCIDMSAERDGVKILNSLDKFVEKLNSTKILKESSFFLFEKMSDFNTHLATIQKDWHVCLTSMVNITKMLHSNLIVTSKMLNYLHAVELAITRQLVAEISPATPEDYLAENWVKQKLLTCENSLLNSIHKKGQQLNLIELNQQFSIEAAGRLIPEFKEKITRQQKLISLIVASEKSILDPKCEKRFKLKELYEFLNETTFLMFLVDKIEKLNITTGWIAIMTGILKIESLVARIRNNGENCTRVLKIDGTNPILKNTKAGGGLIKYGAASGAQLEAISFETCETLKSIESKDMREFLEQLAFGSLTTIIELQPDNYGFIDVEACKRIGFLLPKQLDNNRVPKKEGKEEENSVPNPNPVLISGRALSEDKLRAIVPISTSPMSVPSLQRFSVNADVMLVEIPIKQDYECIFRALGLERIKVIKSLISKQEDLAFRQLIMPEIRNMVINASLPLPEALPRNDKLQQGLKSYKSACGEAEKLCKRIKASKNFSNLKDFKAEHLSNDREFLEWCLREENIIHFEGNLNSIEASLKKLDDNMKIIEEYCLLPSVYQKFLENCYLIENCPLPPSLGQTSVMDAISKLEGYEFYIWESQPDLVLKCVHSYPDANSLTKLTARHILRTNNESNSVAQFSRLINKRYLIADLYQMSISRHLIDYDLLDKLKTSASQQLTTVIRNWEFKRLVQKSDDKNPTKQLSELADKLAFTPFRVHNDYNYFFQAVLYLLQEKLPADYAQSTYKDLVNRVVQHILGHLGGFEGYIPGDLNDFEKHLLQENGWAEDMIVTALCEALNIKIVIINSDGSKPKVKNPSNATQDVIYLAYQIGLGYWALVPRSNFNEENLKKYIDVNDPLSLRSPLSTSPTLSSTYGGFFQSSNTVPDDEEKPEIKQFLLDLKNEVGNKTWDNPTSGLFSSKSTPPGITALRAALKTINDDSESHEMINEFQSVLKILEKNANSEDKDDAKELYVRNYKKAISLGEQFPEFSSSLQNQ